MAAELIWVALGTEGWMLARDGLDVGHIIRYGRDLIGYAVGDDYPDGDPRLTRGDVFSLSMVMDAVRERVAAVEAAREAKVVWRRCDVCGDRKVPVDGDCPSCADMIYTEDEWDEMARAIGEPDDARWHDL